jgi:hypothetical protein
MRILFHKLTDQRHALEIVRDDGQHDRVELETRSCLVHDFLHYAVESRAGLRGGFWGRLAAGRSLAEMNDRTAYAGAPGGMDPEMAVIERVVGAMSGIAKGRTAADLIAGFRQSAASAGTPAPPWLTGPVIEDAAERLRRLTGQWRATPHGQAMAIDWPPAE